MTECDTEVIRFGWLSQRQVVPDFWGGRLTSDAGVLLRKVDRRLGLLDEVTDCLADPRVPEEIPHAQRTMVAQRIFGIAAAYEDLNDHYTLRRESALQTAFQESPLAEEQLALHSTRCRMDNRVTRQSLFDLSAILVEWFLGSYDSAPEEIVLDLGAGRPHARKPGRTILPRLLLPILLLAAVHFRRGADPLCVPASLEHRRGEAQSSDRETTGATVSWPVPKNQDCAAC